MAVTLHGGTEGRSYALPRRLRCYGHRGVASFSWTTGSVVANHRVSYTLQWLPALNHPARDQLLLLLANSAIELCTRLRHCIAAAMV